MNDALTAAAIEQALRLHPEPTREQAHDAVCAAIALVARCLPPDGEDDPHGYLRDIRCLEHAARLLRGAATTEPVEQEIEA